MPKEIPIEYEIIACCQENCHAMIFLPKDKVARLRKTHDSFHCLEGHSQSYQAKSEEDILRDRLKEKDRRIEELLKNQRPRRGRPPKK